MAGYRVEREPRRCRLSTVLREYPHECDLGDWLMIQDAPAEWDAHRSPCSWKAPQGEIWHFAYTELPTIDEVEGEVGTDYVWMRYDPAGPLPRMPRWFIKLKEDDPADRWKSE